MKRLPSRFLLALIALYQRWISPGLPRRCKYYPTCSDYAVEAIRELGPLRGSIVAGWRLLRCNPLSDGGIDDLEDRTLFRGAARSDQGDRHPQIGPPAGANRPTRISPRRYSRPCR